MFWHLLPQGAKLTFQRDLCRNQLWMRFVGSCQTLLFIHVEVGTSQEKSNMHVLLNENENLFLKLLRVFRFTWLRNFPWIFTKLRRLITNYVTVIVLRFSLVTLFITLIVFRFIHKNLFIWHTYFIKKFLSQVFLTFKNVSNCLNIPVFLKHPI